MNKQVIDYSVTDAKIAELAEKFKGMKVTNEEERKAIRVAINEMTTYRTTLETKRKAYKADAIAYNKKVDSIASGIKEKLLVVETPLQEEYQKYMDEKARIKAEKEKRASDIDLKIEGIKNTPMNEFSSTAQKINNAINGLKTQEYTKEDFDGRTGVAELARKDSIARLQEMYEVKTNEEIKAVELEEQAQEIAKHKAENDRKDVDLKKREAAVNTPKIGKVKIVMDKPKEEKTEQAKMLNLPHLVSVATSIQEIAKDPDELWGLNEMLRKANIYVGQFTNGLDYNNPANNGAETDGL